MRRGVVVLSLMGWAAASAHAEPPSAEVAPIREYAPSEASAALIATGKRVGGVLRDIEQPCAQFQGFSCAKGPLERWHRALDAVQAHRGKEGPDAHVIVFGNSLIASDRITDVVRERLQERFGNGGGSFYLLDRLADYGGRFRTGKSDRRWDIFNFSQGARGDWAFGVPGAHHVSQRRGAKTRWRIEGDRKARVFWLDHKTSPGFSLLIDGKPALEVTPKHTGALEITSVDLPPDAKSLDLVADGARLVVHGVEMDAPAAGVRFDTHGIVAADAKKWMSADETQFRTELAARDPDLVVVMLGGNEVRRVAWNRYGLDDVKRETAAFLERLKDVLPTASCLVVGPLHAIEGKDHRKPFQTRPELAPVNRIYREQALEHGCGFFDTYAAMGGDGSLRRFHNNKMLHADYVHPRADGLNFLGEFIAQGLFQAWVSTPRAAELPALAPLAVGALVPDPRHGDVEPLTAVQREARLFRTFDALERRQRARLSIGIIGEGAGTGFGGRIREAFQRRFGARGAGILRGLADGTLKGRAALTSPDPAAYGIAAGLDGNRVHLEKGATFTLALPRQTPARRSEGDDTPGPFLTTQLLWRTGPRAPRAKVKIGRTSTTLRQDRPAFAGGVRQETISANYDDTTLVIESLDEGMFDLLAVALEGQAPGVVVDDLTHQNVRELLRLHPDVAAGQAKAREWDLVLFAPTASDLLAEPTLDRFASGPQPSAPTGARLALQTLQRGVPAAHCIVFGPQGPDSLSDEVDSRARVLAMNAGCGYFSPKVVVGDVQQWQAAGLWSTGVGFNADGQRRLQDLFLQEFAARLDAPERKVASNLDVPTGAP